MPRRNNKKVMFNLHNAMHNKVHNKVHNEDTMELCGTEDAEMGMETDFCQNDQLLYQILGLIRDNGHFCGLVEYNDGTPYLDWCGYNNCIIRE